MYLEHFGLREYPFTLTPDTSFFLPGEHYQAALNTLLVATHAGEGFVKITGEVGTGKTLLCRQFLACLEQSNVAGSSLPVVTAFIPNPYLTPQGLLLSVADELGINLPPDSTHHAALKAINHTLLTLAQQNKRVVLCFDEAQAMPLETLEALRLLTNLETEKQKLLQIVLFGQPELNQKLQQNNIRQLNQRITFHYRLDALSLAEMEYYLFHRLQIAGYRGSPIFNRAAIKTLYRASAGIPRLVNILAHKALMSSFGAGQTMVDARQIKLAAQDTEAVQHRLRWPYPVIVLALIADKIRRIVIRTRE